MKTKISSRGKTSPYWELLCKSFLASAAKHDGAADLVFHGTFGTKDVQPGIKTIDDAWKWLPYENWLVHATLTGEQIKAVVADAKNDRYSDRALYGIALEELVPDKRYGILFNSYDSQSGGRKMMKVREILQEKASQTKLLPINTREALIDWFLEHKTVG